MCANNKLKHIITENVFCAKIFHVITRVDDYNNIIFITYQKLLTIIMLYVICTWYNTNLKEHNTFS